MLQYQGMDQELQHMIEETHEMLEQNLELTRENSKKIQKIRSTMRRAFWGKVVYWIILVFLAAGAAYAARPYVKNALDTYHGIQQQFEKSQKIISDPGAWVKDLGILNKFLGS